MQICVYSCRVEIFTDIHFVAEVETSENVSASPEKSLYHEHDYAIFPELDDFLTSPVQPEVQPKLSSVLTPKSSPIQQLVSSITEQEILTPKPTSLLTPGTNPLQTQVSSTMEQKFPTLEPFSVLTRRSSPVLPVVLSISDQELRTTQPQDTLDTNAYSDISEDDVLEKCTRFDSRKFLVDMFTRDY